MKFVYLVPPKIHSHQVQGFEIARHINLLNAKKHGWIFVRDYNPDNPPTLFEFVCKIMEKFPLEIEQLQKPFSQNILRILILDCYYAATNSAFEHMNLSEQAFPDHQIREIMYDEGVTLKARSFRHEKHPQNIKSISRYAAMQLYIRPDKLDWLDIYMERKEWKTPMNHPIIETLSKKLAVDTNVVNKDSRYLISHAAENVGDEFLYWSSPYALPLLVKEYENHLKEVRLC